MFHHWNGRKKIFPWKSFTKLGSEPQRHWLLKLHALTIASRPALRVINHLGTKHDYRRFYSVLLAGYFTVIEDDKRV